MKKLRIRTMKVCIALLCIISNFSGMKVASAAQPRAATPESAFTFDQTTGEITNYNKAYGTDIQIPETINGVPVIGIRGAWSSDDGSQVWAGAFDAKQLTSVILPNSLKYIGKSAFCFNPKLTTVTFGNSIETLEDGAFEQCSLLSNFTLPDSLITIGNRAFSDCNMVDLVIPDNVVTIGNIGPHKATDQVFNRVSGSLTIGKSVKYIGHSAFTGPITSLVLPDTVEIIGNGAFAVNQLTSLTLPPNVKSIGDSAFINNRNSLIGIETLVLNDKLESIGESCFQYQHLSELTIPDSVKTVGNSAFDSNKLTKIKLSSNMTELASSIFGFNLLEEFTIPDNIEIINYFAFGSNKLKDIHIGSSVTLIDQHAFYGNQLTEVTIPSNVETITFWAFQNNLISKVHFNEGLLEITDGVFQDNKLTDLQFPKSVQNFEADILKGQKAIGKYTKVGTHWELDLDDLSSTMFRDDVETVRNVMFDGASATYNATTHVVTFTSDPANKELTYEYLVAHPTDLSINGGYGDVTLTLEEKLDEITVTFDGDGGTPSASTMKVEKGKTYNTLPTATKKGYTFGGWYTAVNGGGSLVENTTTAVSTTDHILYAKWDVADWTVSFNSNGGNQLIPNQTITSGGLVVKPTNPTKAGYTFIGWYKDAGLTTSFDFAQDTILENTTLYGKWTPTTYTITYENVGTASNSNPIKYDIGTLTITLVNPGPRTGYTFVGWFDADSDTATAVTQIATGSTGDKKIYAKWSTDSYDVTYHNLLGATTINPLAFTIDTPTITLSEPTTRLGYTFDGWYSNDMYTTKVTEITLGTTGNQDLYAKWNIVPYAITYENVGTASNSNPIKYDIGTPTITLANLGTRTGYTFVGWFDDAALTSPITQIANGSTGDKKIYAKWSTDSYDVTYHNLLGATTTNPLAFTMDTPTITLSEPTTRLGYTFDGWYNDAIYTTKVTEITLGTTGNQDLYAKWNKESYAITYEDLHGATTTNPANYNIETTTITLSDPTPRDHYTFDGWYDGVGESATAVSEITIGSTGNKTLYARWTAYTYTLTYENLQGTTTDNVGTYTIETPTITLKGPTTRTGYTFDGWYDDAVYTNKVTEITLGTTGNQTLYAKWKLTTYQIEFHDYKEGDNMNPTTYTIETNDIELAPMPDTVGYKFIGWYDGNQSDAIAITKITKGNSGNLQLYARYENKQAKVSLQDGDTSTKTITATYDKAYGELPNLEKPGYTFAGWYSEPEGKGSHITAETIVSNVADHKLYAHWKQVYFEMETGNVLFENGQNIRYQLNIEETNITDTMKKQENLISVYDIYFLLNDERISVKDNKILITLNLKEPEKYFSHYKVVYFDETGKAVEEFVPAVATDYNTLTFETTHLSHYGIVAWNDDKPNNDNGNISEEDKPSTEKPTMDGGNTSNGNNNTDDSTVTMETTTEVKSDTSATGVSTGIEKQNTEMYIAILMVSFLGLGIAIRKKRELNKNK